MSVLKSALVHDEHSPVPALAPTTARLLRSVCWGLDNGLGARDIVPMLRKLAASVTPGSEVWLFATRALAEELLAVDPWRAALTARALLAHGETDAAHALLGLAHARLGHIRAAVRAFRKALLLNPECASYAHNLGHLLDAGLGRPRDALSYLARARRALDDPEVAASYAHALLRSGDTERARSVLEAHHDQERVQELLARWSGPSG